jgi:SAM-dependent methyltransferase
MDNPNWYKDESFWSAFAPVMFDSRRWAETEAVCDCVERMAGNPAPGESPVLDALCAVGRISVEMAERGYPVTGVDLSPSYLEAARAASVGLPCEFVQGDIREFSRPGAYSLALNLYNSFGYLESPEEDLRMLKAIRACLRPGGLFILEMLGKEIAVRDFKSAEAWERDGLSFATECRVVGAWEGVRNRWTITERGRAREYSFEQRLYAASELARALGSAGFRDIGIFGSYGLAPYDQDADTLLATARA